MAKYLRMFPDTHMAGAELVLEAGVDPLDPGTDPVANTLWHDKTGHTPCPGLVLQVLLELLVTTRVDINQRDMAKTLAHPVDLAGITGRVHEVIEVGRRRAVMVARGIATWLSWTEAEVMMALAGTPQSAVSRCNL